MDQLFATWMQCADGPSQETALQIRAGLLKATAEIEKKHMTPDCRLSELKRLYTALPYEMRGKFKTEMGRIDGQG
jgi:hypothetical protein